MKLTIAPRFGSKSKTFPIEVDISDDGTVNELRKAVHAKAKQYYPDRQRLMYENKVLEDGELLSKYNLQSGDTILFKDLGPQVGWRTVFIIEYLGPLVTHPLIFFMAERIYGKKFEPSQMQLLALTLIVAHFVKRELETMFVHRFSHGTMPVRNIFKNSLHYHIFAGLNLAYWVYGPWNAAGAPGGERQPWEIYVCVGIWTWAQLSNLITHINLRSLRSPGTRERRIPYGYGFNLVTCPNYFFETIAWLAICGLTRSWAAVLFIFIGFAQMYFWAVKKHANYKKEFKEYPRNRKVVIPFIL